MESRPSLVALARQSVVEWVNDYAPSMGAALAYYTLFSLAPLLLLVISIAGLLFGAEAARGEIVGQLGGLIGQDGAKAVEGLLQSAGQTDKSLLASAISVLTLIVGATSIFGELQSDLDRIWDAPASARPSGVWGLLRTRLLSFGLIVSIGFLLLVSLVVSAGLAAFGKWYGAWFPGWTITLQLVNIVASLGMTTALFALMYRILPSRRVAWRHVWYGAFITAVLFTVGKFLIGLYIGKAGVASGFGAAGSIVVLTVWVFYSAQIFLLGAEFTWLYARAHGAEAGANPSSVEQTSAAPASDRPKPYIPARETPLSDGRLRPHEAITAALVFLGFGAARSLFSKRRREG